MIEINRAGSEYIYKLNEMNGRQIMRRKNRHNARWVHWQYALTEESARAMLMKIQKEDEEDDDQ